MKRGEQDAKLSSSVVVEKRKMQSEYDTHKKARVVLGQIHILDDEESEEESDERRDELNWVD